MTPQVLYIPTAMHRGGIGRMGAATNKAPNNDAREVRLSHFVHAVVRGRIDSYKAAGRIVTQVLEMQHFLCPTCQRTEQKTDTQQLNVLGYSSDMNAFAFDFTVTPASKRIIQEFIANHVKDRSVWYSRDDSEGIAQSITHLMPPGTETSLAMPVFGFDGQVAFAVVACWTDPLYSYPAGALQFIETIAGSLLASGMPFSHDDRVMETGVITEMKRGAEKS
jgi:hypothetical protein